MRVIQATLTVLLAAGCASPIGPPLPAIESQLQALEARSGGRLGVAIVDSSGHIVAANRADERFAFCSTFKLLLAGMVLDRHGRGLLSLDERLAVSPDDITFHSPSTKARVEHGWISVADAARAIVTVSDNAAANLLLRRVGGPGALNEWLRRLGDRTTRLDRLEPDLNSNISGDPRDTTSPAAIAASAARLLFGDALGEQERRTLRGWLIDSETGRARIRAGLPRGFVAGDKTGTCGGNGRESYNDVAFVLPDAGATTGFVVAAYLDRPAVDADGANATLAAIGRMASESVVKR